MLIKRVVLVFLFLLTGCIKPISDRVEEQLATAKQPVEKLAYVADRALWRTTLGGTDKQKKSMLVQRRPTIAALPICKARLLSLAPNAARDQWAAITWDHHLAIGSATDGLIATRPIAASIPSIEESGRLDRLGITLAGGVFYGASSGRLYYTTRQLQ